jgi:DNA replication and repair protein RecF
LASAGKQVYEFRYQFLPDLLSAAAEHASGVLNSQHVAFAYRATVEREGDIEANFKTALEHSRPREQALGVTLVGPHRDDIAIRKNEMDLRRFGSEGEQRSAAIALKLAEAGLLQRMRSEAPVFLLDEIASELDPERSERLFNLLATQGQIFYAAAKPVPAQGKVFKVNAGKVEEA